MILIAVATVMFCILGGISIATQLYNLNSIKSKTVGDGQHGTARWATNTETHKTYQTHPFYSKKWRKQAKKGITPTIYKISKIRKALPQGIVVGCKGGKHDTVVFD
jgi:type IV secretion system protein VirD4